MNPTNTQNPNIPVTSIAPVAPLNIGGTISTPVDSATPVVQGANAFATNSDAQIKADQQKILELQNSPKTALQNVYDTLLQGVSTSAEGLQGRGAAQSAAEQAQGLPGINKQRADLNAQILAKTANYDLINKNLEANAGGVTTSTLYGQQGAVNRQSAAEIGLLQARALGLQGQADAAQAAANRSVDLMWQDKEDAYNTKIKQIELVKDQLTAEQKKQADALTYALDKQKARDDKLKQDMKDVQSMLIQAQVAAPANVLANAKAIADKGGSPTEVAMALGKYGGDYYKTELLKQQIKTEKAQQENYYANAAKTRAEATVGGGKAPTPAQVESAGYAERIKQANTIIDKNPDVFKKMNYVDFQLAGSKSQLANSILTPEQRQVAQAMRNFITGKLRKESGASIQPSEFEDAQLQYFPALGDDATTLANKKQLRESVLNNLITGSGTAYNPNTEIDTPAYNPFNKSLGISDTVIPGTSVVSGFSTDGTINFNLPK